MILGIGTDIVDVQRFAHWLENPQLMARYFDDDEIDWATQQGEAGAASLAVRFAAKEAFGKALGVGLHGLRLKDIHVNRGRLGAPRLVLHGSAKQLYDERKATALHVSLSHEKHYAVAVVIIEGDS